MNPNETGSQMLVLRVALLAALITASTELVASSGAGAFALSVGPSNGTFGGTACADVTGGSLNSPTNVQAWACNLAPNQQFEFNGMTIYTMGGQRCLDVYGDGQAPGTPVDSDYCNATPAQKWYYFAGEIYFLGGYGLCLDATNMANGTQLVINACNQGPTQNWQIK